MRSMLVIGLGRFGGNLAVKFAELGYEVMAIDKHEENVSKIAHLVTMAQIGDCSDPDILRSIGVGNFDVCFVCISENFQSSLEITSLLKEMGAKCVVSKADRDVHAKFLRKVGADDVILPERDMAQKTAMRYSTEKAFGYFELTSEYAVFEILAPQDWVGKTVKEINVRSRYNVNIIGIKRADSVIPLTDPQYIFSANEHILIAGKNEDVVRLLNQK